MMCAHNGSSFCLQKVSYRYGHGTRVLNDVSAYISAGATALVGENGAGKTSLMRVMASLLAVDSGTVGVDGVPLSRKMIGEYRTHIGWMPQDIPVISGFTVRESVAYHSWLGKVPRQQSDKWVQQALAQVHLIELEDRKASSLSGGQLRRLGLAQALVRGADWLLLDEPTAGLDPRQKRSLALLLQELRAHVNYVISTHDFDYFEELFDQVVVLHEGRILWQGSTSDYLSIAGGATQTAAFDAFNAILDR